MTKKVNLGAETIEFVRARLAEILGENPQNINKIEFDMKEVKEQIFRLFYDYQVQRNWPHVADRTAMILGVDRRTIYRLLEK